MRPTFRPAVEILESRRLLTTFREETRTDEAFALYGTSGAGTTVAILDRGIDWRHDDFRKANGDTRIKWLLDMSGPSPVEYSEAQINAALDGGQTIDSRDAVGHGTVTTGLAAGDGSAFAGGRYRGMAPDADLVIVKLTSEGAPAHDGQPAETPFQGSIDDALTWLDQKITLLNQPAVALINSGVQWGPIDGTSAVSRQIDEVFGSDRPGRAYVAAAGDEGGLANHAGANYDSTAETVVNFNITTLNSVYLPVWYSGDQPAKITIQLADGASLGPIGPDQYVDQDGIAIYHYLPGQEFYPWQSTSGDRAVWIRITGHSGSGSLHIQGLQNGTGHVDAYGDPGISPRLTFTDHVVPGRLTDYAASQSAIVAGAHVLQTTYRDIDHQDIDLDPAEGTTGQLWTGSSGGPSRDGRPIVVDLTAPGQNAFAAYAPDSYWATFRFNEIEDGGGYYGRAGATSGSAPIVTGAVALMFQVGPELTSAQVENILHQTAASDAFTGATPNADWGYGKLDMRAALEAIHYLTINIATNSVVESAGPAATTAIIARRSVDLSQALTVNLSSSDTGEAHVPASVTIPAGQASVTFTIDAVNDAIVDGTQVVTITASAAGFEGAADTLDVTDDVGPVFTSSPVTSTLEDAAYQYNATAQDDAGGALAITATPLPGWLSLVDHGDGTAKLSGTPANADVGSYNIVLDVSDGIAPAVQQSFTITVGNINDAPVISPSGKALQLPDMNEDNTNSVGVLVSALDTISSDVDVGAFKGIAVTSASSPNGTWQYALNGTTWQNFGTVGLSSARLLAADASTRVRFVPNPNYSGHVSFYFRAWDQTQGTAGSTANITASGGTTAFSSGFGQGVIAVKQVNDAPVLATTVPVLTSIAEDTTNPAGTLVSALVGGVSDVDTGAVKGIAVYLLNNSTGTWQYTVSNGASWLNFGSPTVSTARLLAADATTRVRFVPNANYNGEVGIYFSAWDQTQGANGGTANINSRGGITPFSSVTVRASQTITAVNDAPVIAGVTTANAPSNTPFAFTAASSITLSDIDAGGNAVQLTVQVSQGTLTLASTSGVTFTSGANGQASFVIRGTLTNLNTALSGSTFTPLLNYSGAASVQLTLSDLGNAGAGGALTANRTINLNISHPTIVIDNGQAGYSEISGTWVDSGLKGFNNSSTRFSTTSPASVRWTPTLSAGYYSVAIYNLTGAGSSTTAQVSVLHNGVTEPNQTLNQSTGTSGFVELGTFFFSGTGSEYVQLSRTGAGFLRADAVRFVKLPSNAAPSVSVPGAQTIQRNASITFSTAIGRAITLSDPDATPTSIEQVTLSVPSGTLTLGSLTGLTITGGGNGQNTITARGTLTDLNAALQGLVFTPALNSMTTAALQVSLNDLGTNGGGGPLTATKTINIGIEYLIDNGTAGYSEVGTLGTWSNSGLTGVNNSGTRFSAAGGAAAVWTPSGLAAGQYMVLFYKVVNPVSSTNAKITITRTGGSDLQTLDLTTGASGFVNLGTFNFSGTGTESIRLSQGTTIGTLRADSVKFVRVG